MLLLVILVEGINIVLGFVALLFGGALGVARQEEYSRAVRCPGEVRHGSSVMRELPCLAACVLNEVNLVRFFIGVAAISGCFTQKRDALAVRRPAWLLFPPGIAGHLRQVTATCVDAPDMPDELVRFPIGLSLYEGELLAVGR